ncbi:HNH endonuclease [Arthrobacter sp. BL-252-APC-1A]|uniref:HNH endonuclease n=1 Tax=Arthrobacter sp. BL-252-APC-1A TaxID=2606622 RepID=UPI001E332AD1|nr:HNH endonuclease signature motif containing protein [Arthrobacter sp. BL-252-APC-1A]
MLEMEAVPPIAAPTSTGASPSLHRRSKSLEGTENCSFDPRLPVKGRSTAMPDQTGPSLSDAGQPLTPGRRDHPLPVSSPATNSLRENVTAWLHYLQDPVHEADIATEIADSDLVDLMRVLEELKSAAAAVQARAAAAFDASQRRAQSRAGVPADQLGRGIGAQVALARRDSPHRGARHLGFGKALVHEMPYTLAALSAGVLSEWRATLLVRETACLDLEDRARVDELICKDPDKLEGLGDRRLIARIRTVTQALDQASQVKRNAKAVADRYVSCRPAPDTMSYLSALLPVAQGVAVYAALSRAADGLRASGDERGRGQIMADTLVERVTGQGSADRVPVEVQLVITDRSLFRQSGPDEPAYFPGYGTVPGYWARELISKALTNPPGHSTVPLNPLRSGNSTQRNSSRPRSPLGRGSPQAPPGSSNSPQSPPRNGNSPQTAPGNSNSSHQTAPGPGNSPQIGEPGGPEPADVVMLRRLYLDPVSGELAAMESRARAFPPGLARLIRTRDQTCRTPWCDAPIRHIDHIQSHAEGGPTTYTNGQGLCEACNHAKQAPGWNSTTLQPQQLPQQPFQPQRPPRPPEAVPQPPQLPQPRHKVRITTPTGHAYLSASPALPGSGDIATCTSTTTGESG